MHADEQNDQMMTRERTRLLNDDRSDKCIGLYVPHSDVSVLAACIENIISCDEGKNGAMSAVDSAEEL
jgi:hypothetical protein